MINVTEALIESIELDESAKTDFIAKFGQDTFTNFEKAKQRLVNAGRSTDYGQYLKLSKEEVDSLIQSLYAKPKDAQKLRQLKGTDKEIRGKYNYLGEKNGFKVYQPLDYISSMDLGVNTGWCTTGRYGHAGHPDYAPSEEDAKEHFNRYKKYGIKLYYFLNPNTMYGEYAIALYPRIRVANKIVDNFYINEANIELFNAKDNLDYESLDKLPTDLIPEEIVCKTKTFENGLLIDNNIVVKCSKDVKSVVIPDGVTKIENYAFDNCSALTSIIIPSSVIEIGDFAFIDCEALESVIIPDSVTKIGECAFLGCDSLTSITIPDSVKEIGKRVFCFYLDGNDNLTVYTKNPVAIDYCEYYGIKYKLQEEYKNKKELIKMNQELQEVKLNSTDTSSAIQALGYDKETKDLYVRYKSSDVIYVYQDVDQQTFDELCAAKSRGSYLYHAIAHGGHKCIKYTPEVFGEIEEN